MSFVILILIFFLLYTVLTTYGSIVKVVVMLCIIFGMTSAFLIYGLNSLKPGDTFIVINTEIDKVSFFHVCIAWFLADLVVTFRIIRNYRYYLEINSASAAISVQERE
jgi:hypothetical protein